MNKFFIYTIIFIAVDIFANSLNTSLANYNLPKNKQGISDRNNNALSSKRYSVLKNELSIGIQKYNYYWRDAENKTASSKKIQTCKKNLILFPKNEKQKKLLGINNYHCYNKNFINNWEKRFKQNTSHNIQIAVVLWTAPEIYIDKGCEGFYFSLQKRHLKGGCYPISKHYDDYEDWIRFTAYKFGKYIDHYIVWNEASSTNWADISTEKYPKNKLSNNLAFHMKRSFDIYGTLLERTILAVDALDKECVNFNEMCKNLVYLSLTHDWYSNNIKIKNTNHHDIDWRNLNLLDYIWKRFGLKYDWAIAIHPYGKVYSKNKNVLRFSTLGDLSTYQKQQINLYKKDKSRNWLSYPQSRLFASEQNVATKTKPNDWKEKAKYICQSYDVALKMPELIAITHNHFQDNIHRKNKNPTEHTMLPSSVKEDLSNADTYETYQAYRSTSLLTWNKKNNHYCCINYNLGCNKLVDKKGL